MKKTTQRVSLQEVNDYYETHKGEPGVTLARVSQQFGYSAEALGVWRYRQGTGAVRGGARAYKRRLGLDSESEVPLNAEQREQRARAMEADAAQAGAGAERAWGQCCLARHTRQWAAAENWILECRELVWRQIELNQLAEALRNED